MTNGRNFNNVSSRPRILIAPLEWGLGHATRCIPLINELINQQCEVFIAAEGATFSLLEKEFPGLNFLPFTGYRVTYSRKRYLLPLKILLQLPKMIFTIYREHQLLSKIVKRYKIDAVISDNRFGMYHSTIPSIYITHQLLIKTGNAFTEKVARHIHYYFIKKYSQCWIPDYELNGLSGELSHPATLPGNIKYIGCLSRFELMNVEKKYDLLISLSGPEPQRSIFEDQVLDQVREYTGKVLFIRGLPGESEIPQSNHPHLEIKNHLSANELNKAILQSGMVISRCGYTTVMDLAKLKKTAILIPTPGQTEQEYLATYLMEKNLFYTISQKKFELKKTLKEAALFPFSVNNYNMDQYKIAIHQFVQSLYSQPLAHTEL